jgi:hypothetical protein
MSDEEYLFETLVDLGVAELNGMTKDGEVTYNFDMVKMKEHFPELYEVMIEETEQALVDLYEKGIVEIEYDENLEPYFSIPEEAKHYVQQMLTFREDEDEG